MHAETTALGAAYLAGLFTGYFKNCEEIRAIYKPTKTFNPQMDKATVEDIYSGWKKAVATAQQFKH
jgi:glycerol kinase